MWMIQDVSLGRFSPFTNLLHTLLLWIRLRSIRLTVRFLKDVRSQPNASNAQTSMFSGNACTTELWAYRQWAVRNQEVRPIWSCVHLASTKWQASGTVGKTPYCIGWSKFPLQKGHHRDKFFHFAGSLANSNSWKNFILEVAPSKDRVALLLPKPLTQPSKNSFERSVRIFILETVHSGFQYNIHWSSILKGKAYPHLLRFEPNKFLCFRDDRHFLFTHFKL